MVKRRLPPTRALLLVLALLVVEAGSATAQNIVLVIADDMGVETLASYGEQPVVATTPTLDGLATQGVLFRNAWGYPVCSPFRASVMTGLQPNAHGVGYAINGTYPERDFLLDTSQPTLANLLGAAGYRTAALGKWHLGNELGFLQIHYFDGILSATESHPNDTGFDHFAGHLFGGLNYYNWPKTVNGVTAWSTVYATTDTIDGAVGQLAGSEPFFLWVAFNAPHTPLHEPPHGLLADPDAYDFSQDLDSFHAMIEAMDKELGRLLAALDLSDTTVIFVADNGTIGPLIQPPLLSNHGKTTVYEGGVNVPLIVAGQAVGPLARGQESPGLVQATDIFATVLDIAGVEGPPREDSVSFRRQLSYPSLASGRTIVYTESFLPNGGPIDPTTHNRAASDGRYKLVRNGLAEAELYDLLGDPYEQSPLPITVGAHYYEAYLALEAALATGRGRLEATLPALGAPLLALLATLLAASAVSALRRA